MKSSHQSSLKLTVRRLAVAAVTFGLLCAAAPASAQLVRIGASVGALEPGGFMRGTDTAYDPVHGVYLLVTGNGPIFGVFVNSLGLPVSGAFLIMDGSGWGHFPRAEYSPDVFGGQGGFLVTWHHNIGVNCVFGRLVSVSAGGVASGIVQISDGTQGGSWWETGAAMAYSRTSRRFLVAWRTAQYGILGRLIDFNGVLASTIIPLENAFGSRDPSLAWNPATDEFGLASTGFGASAFAAFRRVRASDGAVSARTTFGFGAGTFATAIDVNAWTNQYVMAWSLHPGTMTATFDPFGNQVATNFVTGRLGHDQSLGLAFNASSGTFLAVGSDHYSAEIAAVEVKGGGAPNSVADIITNGASARGGSYYPLTTAQAGTNQWDVVYSRDFRGATSQIIATTSTGGGSPTPTPTLAPTPTAAPTPTPTPTAGCATPDPFVSIGGGTLHQRWMAARRQHRAHTDAYADTDTDADTDADPRLRDAGSVRLDRRGDVRQRRLATRHLHTDAYAYADTDAHADTVAHAGTCAHLHNA